MLKYFLYKFYKGDKMNLNSVVQRVQNYLSFKLGQEMMKSAGGGGLFFILYKSY